jgi:4-hydroxy-3-methylbut-2-en-1-yl diphosphate synthase IspG/GcpE
VTVAYLNRTLDQELTAIVRGASLECLVCGEFLLHASPSLIGATVIACPECGSSLVDGLAVAAESGLEQLTSG